MKVITNRIEITIRLFKLG